MGSRWRLGEEDRTGREEQMGLVKGRFEDDKGVRWRCHGADLVDGGMREV